MTDHNFIARDFLTHTLPESRRAQYLLRPTKIQLLTMLERQPAAHGKASRRKKASELCSLALPAIATLRPPPDPYPFARSRPLDHRTASSKLYANDSDRCGVRASPLRGDVMSNCLTMNASFSVAHSATRLIRPLTSRQHESNAQRMDKEPSTVEAYG